MSELDAGRQDADAESCGDTLLELPYRGEGETAISAVSTVIYGEIVQCARR